jgi:hypothetical protein
MSQQLFYLIYPDQLPHNCIEFSQSIPDDVACSLISCIHFCAQSSDTEMLTRVEKALCKIPKTVKEALYDNSDRNLPNERYEEHDRYFNIKRICGNSSILFVHSTLQAYYELLDEALATEVHLEQRTLSLLRATFEYLLAYVLRGRTASSLDREILQAERTVLCRRSLNPLHRWRMGHHIFLAIIQGLIVAFHCFDYAMHSADLHEGKEALKLATILMRGSGVALQFTGGFHVDEYLRIVRPSMTPPNLEAGFSGLQSIDHQYLIKQLTRLKSTLLALDPCLATEYRLFLQELDATYDSHKFVCAQFRGDKQHSLRMSQTSKKTAVEVLEQLKQSRLKSIQPPELRS